MTQCTFDNYCAITRFMELFMELKIQYPENRNPEMVLKLENIYNYINENLEDEELIEICQLQLQYIKTDDKNLKKIIFDKNHKYHEKHKIKN